LLGKLAVLAAIPAIPKLLRAAHAEQRTTPRRIGVLLAAQSVTGKYARAFRDGLRDSGYVEGRDVLIEWRSAEGDYTQLPQLIAGLIQDKVELIVTDTTFTVRAIQRAAPTIPVVTAVVADPVSSGLVKSLAHPGGSLTGLSLMASELSPKRLELLREAIPRLTLVAVLSNPDTPFHPNVIRKLKEVAPTLSIDLIVVEARTTEELPSAVSAAKRSHAHALYLIEDALSFAHRATISSLATKAKIPTIGWVRDFPEEGGFISYGANFTDLYRRSAGFVDKILKGAKPGDLPIEQPTQFELAVNLKTAKAVGIAIPESILARADEVVQ
jgi:putative ABC transport system substrate-binding protein